MLHSCTDMATVDVKGSTTLHIFQPSQSNEHDGRGFVSHRASHTTRSRYADEVAGRDYHFISLDEFDRGIKLVCLSRQLLQPASTVLITNVCDLTIVNCVT